MPSRYFAPKEIQLKIETKGAESFKTDVIVLVSVKAVVGTLKDLELFFNYSPNLKSSNSSVKIGDLAEGSTKLVELTVRKASNKTKSDRWVQVRASYFPDYPAIIEAAKLDFRKNPGKYPNGSERSALLSRLAKYKSEGGSQKKNEALTYNFAE
jgi:hypothetical protein